MMEAKEEKMKAMRTPTMNYPEVLARCRADALLKLSLRHGEAAHPLERRVERDAAIEAICRTFEITPAEFFFGRPRNFDSPINHAKRLGAYLQYRVAEFTLDESAYDSGVTYEAIRERSQLVEHWLRAGDQRIIDEMDALEAMYEKVLEERKTVALSA